MTETEESALTPEQGNLTACANLAICYRDGKGVEQQTGGIEYGNYLPGWCCETGTGMPKNLEKAIEYYEKAAEDMTNSRGLKYCLHFFPDIVE